MRSIAPPPSPIPKDINGHPARLTPTYNRAGALEAVKLDNDTYVEHIAYNAKGQRVLITYGNAVMTRYSYDPCTFRLIRLRTEKCSRPDDLTWQSAPTGAPKDWLFQDFTYAYDLAGNITAIQDCTPESGLSATPDRLNRVFAYEPIYRLVSATGREYAAQRPQNIWDDVIHPPDLTKTAFYTQTYGYDPAGNLSKLSHTAANSAYNYTRRFDLAPNQDGDGSNRLQSVTVGSDVYAYQYDNSGNIIQETLSRFYFWDHADRLVGFKIQNGAGVSVDARYLYGSDGMRIKKWVRTNGTGVPESIVYIDGIFEYHQWKKAK
jgi:YD repeat-containing protein